MSTAGPKQQVFASLAEIAQALGHAHRLELLEHLGQGERSVEELAARAGLTLANASRHLQLLRRAALVEGRREGKRVFYRLSGEDAVIDLLRALSRVGERNSAEIARIGRDPLAHGDALVLGFAPRPRDQVRVEVEGIHPADDDPRKRRGEISVAAAQIERRHALPYPERAQQAGGIREEGRPPITGRHRRSGEHACHGRSLRGSGVDDSLSFIQLI